MFYFSRQLVTKIVRTASLLPYSMLVESLLGHSMLRQPGIAFVDLVQR